ncbi:LOW QUALITY PROTEIN: drebrin [Menidia menidia]
MAVNLSKNRLALLTAYQDVIDETSGTDWSLYTYEDDSNDLTLASSGGGGLAEISLTFDSGRVMYGFCSLKEASALPRYILINWVGDDVPDARKCACASHVATIADFFQGVEVIINASSLEDVDPLAIGQRLANGAAAAAASPVLSRLRTRDEDGAEVGTVYQKTNAEVEMKKINREEFWEQAKREEELRKEEERRKAAEERRRFEEERMELERMEQENRERRYREREQQIEEHRKKLLEEEESRERLQSQTAMAAEASLEDLNLSKRESEVEEAKAIIAQRSENPREFFKQKERALTISVDTSPVCLHRTGENDDEASIERNMAAVSPIPKIVTTPIKEDFSREEEEDLWDSMPKQDSPPAAARPVQSVAPQTRDPRRPPRPGPRRRKPDGPVGRAAGRRPSDRRCRGNRCRAAPAPAELRRDDGRRAVPGSVGAVAVGAVAVAVGDEDPSSLVDVTGGGQMTLSYQHALQHAAGAGPEGGTLLMTNGDTLLKEGTQASEGYFSQSQEEEFGQSEESSAKPAPVFYNKPPEIDITCWDADPVGDEDED